jgi:ribulose 1,5-bisphosphate carboxylase large subunit-like protein
MYDEALVHGVDVHSQIREEMEEQNNNHYIVNVRDQIMAANTERIINSGVSRLAFPVGVAHADGLTKIFRDKNISFVLIDHPAVSATLRKLHQGGEVNAKNVQIRRMLKGVKKDIESIFVEVQRSPISSTKPIFKYIRDMEDGLFGGGC